jgi:glycosyltransferase involved in cell wall biosynthesis
MSFDIFRDGAPVAESDVMQTEAPARVSVAAVIPCYNAARFVADAVDSVLAQTYPVGDVIVVNDGSTDDSARILARYKSPVRVINQVNRGMASARNAGIDAVTSSLIAFLDADDRWHPRKTEEQVRFLRDRPDVALVFSDRSWIDANGRPVGAPLHRHPTEPSLRTLLQGNFIQPSTVLLKRAALEADRFDEALHGTEDWDLWLRLAVRCQFGYVDKPLVDYRLHGSNTSTKSESMLRGFVAVLDRALARGLPPDLRTAAEAHRRALLEGLGHYAFERNDWGEARQLFQQSGRQFGGSARRRFALTLLPQPIRDAVSTLRQRFLHHGPS